MLSEWSLSSHHSYPHHIFEIACLRYWVIGLFALSRNCGQSRMPDCLCQIFFPPFSRKWSSCEQLNTLPQYLLPNHILVSFIQGGITWKAWVVGVTKRWLGFERLGQFYFTEHYCWGKFLGGFCRRVAGGDLCFVMFNFRLTGGLTSLCYLFVSDYMYRSKAFVFCVSELRLTGRLYCQNTENLPAWQELTHARRSERTIAITG